MLDRNLTPDDFDDEEAWMDHVERMMDADYYGDDGIDFADPSGHSALRAASASNPRNLPCPDCGGKNRLTPQDVALGYCCDTCADRRERGMEY